MNQQMPYPGNTGQQMPQQQAGFQDPYALPQQYEQPYPYQDPHAFQQSSPYQDPSAFQQPSYQNFNPYPQQPGYQDPNAYAQQASFQNPNELPQQMAYQNQISAPQPAPPQQPVSQPQSAPKGKSGFGIAGLTLGIVAAATSFIPIINNGSLVMGLLGIVFGAIGLQQIRKGKKSGMGISWAAVITGLIAIIVTLAAQAYVTSALDDAMTTSGKVVSPSSASATSSGSAQSSTSSSASSSAASSASSSGSTSVKSTTDMPLGTYANVGSGLQVTVNSVTPGLTKYDGSEVVAVNVTYKNTGKSAASFNIWDWKAENSQGVQTSTTFYSGEEDLGYGTLAPDGTVTGNIYFDPDVVKVLYYSSILSRDTNISWLA